VGLSPGQPWRRDRREGGGECGDHPSSPTIRRRPTITAR
jgi:hypothetical protein